MKKIELCMVGLMVGLIVGLVQIAVISSSDSSYDPWLDLNEDGTNDVNDLYILASIYGTSGTPINKTEWILELEAKLDSLNATLLTDYYNITDSDDRFVNVPGDTMTGTLSVTGTPYGVEGYGSNAGGYFEDTDSSGYAFLGYGDYGVLGYGSTMGGYFKDTDGTGSAYLGNGDYGVIGYGSNVGGSFFDIDDTSRVYLAYGDYGIYQNIGTMNYFAGDVGIGTSSPSGNLEIESSSVWPSIYLDNQKLGDMTTLIRFQEGGVTQWGIGTDVGADGSDNFWIWDYTNGGTRLHIDAQGNVGIGTTIPARKLDVEGFVQAYGYYTGDIIFQKDGEKLWRMFEDEDGLYLESLRNGKVYGFVLQEVDSGRLLELSSEHFSITEGITGFVIALGVVFGVIRYRARGNKEEIDAQQTKLSKWQ